MRTHNLRPPLTVAQTEHRQLLGLAAAGGGAHAAAAERLLEEMERARVVPDTKLPKDIVRMGSRVQYRTDQDEVIEVTLVYPAKADISQGLVSVLTPVGAALVGLRTGQSITWEDRSGRKHVLTVISVVQPVHEPAEA